MNQVHEQQELNMNFVHEPARTFKNVHELLPVFMHSSGTFLKVHHVLELRMAGEGNKANVTCRKG